MFHKRYHLAVQDICSGIINSMKVVVAVSGGVDSVVLLDMLVKRWKRIAEGTSASHELQGEERFLELISKNSAEGPAPPFVVAHFDHGIRNDSADDARFVQGLADFYGLPFEARREDLGPHASEELARTRRYAFLQEVADQQKATIATAHHMNDVAETIAINLTRGTGWRGLAVLDRDILRPLLGTTKQEILQYACDHQLEWCEDSTNGSDAYLRNRLRRNITDETLVRTLAELRDKQVEVKDKIHEELMAIIDDEPYRRYFFSQIEAATAVECLRMMTDARLTRPQAERLLLAIKTQKSGSRYDAGAGIKVYFTTRHFSLEMVKY